MMRLYRFSTLKHAEKMDGKGAYLNGGRWNSMGVPMIYASSSASLAFLELLRRFLPRQIPLDFCLVEYSLPDDVGIEVVRLQDLPEDWDSAQHGGATQKLGDSFISSNKKLLLKVPSVLLPASFHYNMNPLHRDIGRVKITKVDEHPMNLELFVK